MVDPDATPDDGLPAEEVPTSPEIAVGLTCPECKGQRMTLAITEVNPDGTTAKALASHCSLCKASGMVDKATFTRWHQSREARSGG